MRGNETQIEGFADIVIGLEGVSGCIVGTINPENGQGNAYYHNIRSGVEMGEFGKNVNVWEMTLLGKNFVFINGQPVRQETIKSSEVGGQPTERIDYTPFTLSEFEIKSLVQLLQG